MERLKGRVAVVTGAAGGLGVAICQRLAAEGAKVALWDLDYGQAQETAAGLPGGPDYAAAVHVDVADSASVEVAATHTRAALGAIDILVNNAGIVEVAPPWDVTEASWDRHFAINATGAFNCVRAVLPDMRAQSSGKIVNIGSMAALQGRPNTSPAYAASKGAILGLTHSLAYNLGPYGICVNAVNPGFIRTPIFDDWSEEQLALTMANIPLRHKGDPHAHGRPSDVAAAVAYLASPDADFVTGAFLSVNGGTRTG